MVRGLSKESTSLNSGIAVGMRFTETKLQT